MINLLSVGKKQLRFYCDPAVIRQLDARYQEAAEVLGAIRRSSSGFVLPTDDLLLLGRHPLAQGLLAYQRGHIKSERAEKLAHEISQLNQSSLDSLVISRQRVLQLQCLLPDVETRGEAIRVINDFKYDQARLDDSLKALVDALGDDYRRFIGIVKTVSFVQVLRMGELPYFSGTDTDSWGAMHITDPADDFVLVESLTHEAAHHWLFTVEEITPIAKNPWSGSKWISPWRSDLRPIGGIVHGVFVFSCVATVLHSLLMHKTAEANHSAKLRVAKRICRIIAQVEAGLDEMQLCFEITAAGASLASEATERIRSLETSVDATLLGEAREQCEKEQNRKRARYSCDVTAS